MKSEEGEQRVKSSREYSCAPLLQQITLMDNGVLPGSMELLR